MTVCIKHNLSKRNANLLFIKTCVERDYLSQGYERDYGFNKSSRAVQVQIDMSIEAKYGNRQTCSNVYGFEQIS